MCFSNSFLSVQTPLEVEFLAAACLCSSQGHCFVARHMRPKMVEGQGEALFKAYVGFAGGARHVAYDCICWWVHTGDKEIRLYITAHICCTYVCMYLWSISISAWLLFAMDCLWSSVNSIHIS